MNRLTVILVSTLGVIAFGSSAAEIGYGSPAAGERASPVLVTAWDHGDRSFEVIVHLVEDEPKTAALSRDDPPESRLSAIRSLVERASQRLRQRISAADLQVSRTFALQPAFAATVSRSGLSELLEDPTVRFVQEDGAWPVHTIEGLEIINADLLQIYGITGDDTAVAIIDTGIDPLHPALGGGAIPNAKVVHGLDTADNDDDATDCSGHGTAVASIAAGTPYQWSPILRFGGGVAPEARIFAYKASRDSECGVLVESAVVAAIEDAVLRRNGEDYTLAAINISAGAGNYAGACDVPFSSYANAVDTAVRAGVAVIASAGNEGRGDAINAPACLSTVLSVGSVWDSDASVAGSAFCLNSECSEFCDDANKDALQMTCYSNSSPDLDVLAPSEYLRTALANGQVAEFGGTSGAAPYVTGAVALLRDAFFDLDPMHAAILLKLTGQPIPDLRNGLIHSLIDLEAALDLRGVALGEDTLLAIPTDSNSTLRSRTYVNTEGRLGHLRVLVKISHPEPSALVIRLLAPDGAAAVLHSRGPGTTSAPNGIDRFAGIDAIYPDSAQAVESLDRFANCALRGEWTLEIASDALSEFAATPPTLLGWALEIEAKSAPQPPQPSSCFLPVAARAPGANDTFWVTDIRMLNSSQKDYAEARLYLVPAGADGTRTFEQRDIGIPPRTVLDLPDFLDHRFGLQDFQGQVLIQTEAHGLITTSRIYNTAAADGTYGQYEGALPSSEATGFADRPLVLLQLSNNAAYRTNIGFSEVNGAAATVTLTLTDGDTGEAAGAVGVYDLQPYSNLQVNRVFETLAAGTTDNAHATVSVSDGAGLVTAYASVVDNVTGDAIFIPGSRPETGSSWILPVVAKAEGRAGTDWVSDVRVANLGQETATLVLEYRPQQGSDGSFASASVEVAAGRVHCADDILATVFGLENAGGSLRIASTEAPATLIVTSRTYNRTDAGSFGQFIPSVIDGFRGTATVIHLDKSGDFRTNLGICEVAGGTVGVLVTMLDGSGVAQGETQLITLAPFELRQVNDIYAFLGAPAQSNSRIEVSLLAGTGAFTAYASVVDRVTGDAIYVPAAAVATD